MQLAVVQVAVDGKEDCSTLQPPGKLHVLRHEAARGLAALTGGVAEDDFDVGGNVIVPRPLCKKDWLGELQNRNQVGGAREQQGMQGEGQQARDPHESARDGANRPG